MEIWRNMSSNKTIDLTRIFTPNPEAIAKLLLTYFGSNPYYAMAKLIAGEVTYQPIKQTLTEQILQSHLKGEVTLGSYHINKSDGTVSWIGWDVDSNDPMSAREYTKIICDRLKNIPHGVEFSGSKGYHILIFLSEPIPAEKAKQFSEQIRGELPKSGKTHVECYPKQGSLTANSPMGSLLKIPLGEHPRTHNKSRFVDIENGWENGDELSPEEIMTNVVTPDTIFKNLISDKDPADLLVELMVPYWIGGERHNIALYLSGYLAHLGWGMQATEEVIRAIALEAGDTDIYNRVEGVKDTFRSLSAGKTVKGFSGLNEILPGAALKSLTEYATKVITPTLVKQIDGVRLSKGAIFEKIRAVAHIIWMSLQEQGDLVQTAAGNCYWYNSSSHLLTDLSSEKWEAVLHAEYGINPAESFGRQVTEAIRLRTISEAKTVTIQNRSLWTEEKLFINLGGSAVYILDGDNIQVSYNGECGYLFQTDGSSDRQIVPDTEDPIDIWSKLVEDVSFLKSSDAPATPEEQKELLKAWILAFFFQELMPTKPLLLAMGAPGSGKTTAIRRILKILEAPDSEVLEVAGDKPDSLRASIASHRLLALDNLEKSEARWLVDTLNRLATGANIELRQLYKTNETYTLKPNCFVAMTAVSMPFSEETLFSRILPLEMQQLDSPLPEYFLQKQLQENTDKIWGDLLLKLNKVVKSLTTDRTHIPPITSRLADFTVFCKRINKSNVLDGETLMRGLRSLVDRQRIALLEATPFVAVLEQWLASGDQEIGNYHTYQQFYAIVEPLARARKLEWRWNNATSLERHIAVLAPQLSKLYGAEFSEQQEVSGKTSPRIRFKRAV